MLALTAAATPRRAPSPFFNLSKCAVNAGYAAFDAEMFDNDCDPRIVAVGASSVIK